MHTVVRFIIERFFLKILDIFSIFKVTAEYGNIIAYFLDCKRKWQNISNSFVGFFFFFERVTFFFINFNFYIIYDIYNRIEKNMNINDIIIINFYYSKNFILFQNYFTINKNKNHF